MPLTSKHLLHLFSPSDASEPEKAKPQETVEGTGPKKTLAPELESLLAQARAARQQGPRAPARSEEERRQLGEAYARVAHRLTEDERAELHRRMRREAHPDEQIE